MNYNLNYKMQNKAFLFVVSDNVDLCDNVL